jgi:Transposase
MGEDSALLVALTAVGGLLVATLTLTSSRADRRRDDDEKATAQRRAVELAFTGVDAADALTVLCVCFSRDRSAGEAGSLSEGAQRMGRSSEQEPSLSKIRKYRKFTVPQKTEMVLASLRGPKTTAELCREHEIADSLLRKWREQLLGAGAERPQGNRARGDR